MRWPWSRRRWAWEPVNHTDPIPDGDIVLPPGQHQRTADLLAAEAARRALQEPTIMLGRPLLTRAQAWRGAGGRESIRPETR